MKTITKTLSLFGLGLLITLSACKKEAGPVGPQGPAGKDGNANVVLYKFEGNDFSSSFDKFSNISMPRDSFDKFAWFTYLKYNNSLTYPIPGFGNGGSSEYRVYFSYLASSVDVVVNKVSGPGEAYDSIKVVGIQIGKVIGKKDDLPNIDFNDYNAVKAYYGLND